MVCRVVSCGFVRRGGLILLFELDGSAVFSVLPEKIAQMLARVSAFLLGTLEEFGSVIGSERDHNPCVCHCMPPGLFSQTMIERQAVLA